MKKLGLIAAIISTVVNLMFSQQKYYFQIDRTFKKLSFDSTTINLNYENKKDYQSLLNNSLNGMKNFPFSSTDKKSYSAESWIGSIDSTQNYDNMPIIIPKGNYSMLIVKPDTSINYYLLIKKP